MKTLLIVEDSEDDVFFLRRALKSVGISGSVHVANDGQEAIDYMAGKGKFADRHKYPLPSLILLDLKLPKVDGLEVLGAVKGDPRTRAIPVVMLTSSREESDLVRSYELGVNAFVVKPVGFKEFFDAIQDLGVFWAVLNEPPPHRGGWPSNT